MASMFSSPLVHTAYYFREVFSPAPPRETEALKALVLREHGFGDRIRYKDFAFDEHVNCSNMANGIFMRLNACSLMKLRHWCLYPTESTPKKIAQYVAYILLSPLAALVDLVTNVVLLIFKLSAWPILRIAMRTDDLAKECLYQNVCWHFDAVSESFKNLGWTFFESIVCTLAGPRWTSRVDWCYSVCRYEGPDIPFVTQRRAIFGIAMPMNEEEQRASYVGMSRHYNAWFQNGTWERILDPQRARYLREHCGWSNLSDQQLKDENFRLLGFKDTRIAYRFNPDHQNFTLILDGEHRYKTGDGRNYSIDHTDSFIQRILLPVPPLPVPLAHFPSLH